MELKKQLGLLEIFCISTGAMISSGLFILPGLAYAKTGPLVVIAYAIASILILPTVLSKAELVTAMPKAGGNFFYINRAMGPHIGTLGGFADWFSVSLKSAFALLGMGIFVILINPGVSEFQIKLIAVACCLVFLVVNIAGAKLAGRFQVAMVVVLLGLLCLYILMGVFFVKPERYTPFAPYGFGSIFATAGLVFVSFAGLTKIAGIAEEVRNPNRNIPLGLLLSWAFVSVFYFFVIFITVGLVDHAELENSMVPISLGASSFLGWGGSLVMGIAALLAFATTANAGLMSASRTPLAMSRDELIPKALKRISRQGTPSVSIVFTSSFMIFIILFLSLENLVKAASTMILLLFILVNISLIFMRESNIRHYRPKYRAPFYPFMQIIGIIGYMLLIVEMGVVPLLISGIFIFFSLVWYLVYAQGRIKREYAFLHVVERIMGEKYTDHLLDEELREVLIERDNINETRFENKLRGAIVLDLDYFVPPQEFADRVAEPLAGRLKVEKQKIYSWMLDRERDSNILVCEGFAVISFVIKGHNKFELALVRTKRGAMFSETFTPVNAAFVVVSSSDMQNFYLHSLMWMVQIAERTDFRDEWLNAKNTEELRDIIIASFKKSGWKWIELKDNKN